MRIERLQIKGFMRFREPLALDLTTLPAGLIAITGENGAGKSTLLEAVPAALYRSFLSRGDLVDYATDRDSYLEVQLAVDGRGAYRARVNVDGVKRGSDAVLEQLQPGGGRVTLNDGKVSTYDAAISQQFPSKDLLLASAFAAQNKAGSFIALDKKARKTLFMQLLGIERYEAMSSTARQAAALVEAARGRLVAVREELARSAGPEVLAAIERDRQALQLQRADTEQQRGRLLETLTTLEARLAAMADAQAAYGAAQLRVTTLQASLRDRHAEHQALVAERERFERSAAIEREAIEVRRRSELDAIARALREADALLERELADIETARAAEVADCGNKIAGNEQIRGMASQIRDAVIRLQAIDLEAAGLTAEKSASQADLIGEREALFRLEQQLRALDGPAADLKRAQADAALLGSVPCGGTGAFAPCQFLTNATAAAGKIPDLALVLSSERTRLEPQIAAARQAIADKDGENRRRGIRLEQLQGERTSLERLAKYAEPLAAAEARIAELTERQQKADVDAAAARDAARVRHAARVRELGDRETASDAAAEDARTALRDRCQAQEDARSTRMLDVNTAIGRLSLDLQEAETDLAEAAEGNQRAAAVREQLASTRLQWDSLTALLATTDANLATFARLQQNAEAALARLATIEARVDRLTSELLEWQLLAKAFSRDGLPVLEIDAAGPTISALTNDLLAACFGSRFSVELVTQQAKADGKGMKEAFTVAVTDNATGAQRDIADLSGGEQVIVAEALMAAIAVYVNQRSTNPIRTCWRDETTGALDPENAQRYFAMLRRLHDLGGFERTFFISHNPDIAAMADAQIQVRNGGAEVALPPFAVVEAA